jgi:hypothetical protein
MSKKNTFLGNYYTTPGAGAIQRGHEKMLRNGQRVRMVLRAFGTFDPLARANSVQTFLSSVRMDGNRNEALNLARAMVRLRFAKG